VKTATRSGRRRWKLDSGHSARCLAGRALAAILAFLSSGSLLAQTLVSDKDDYAPGETAYLTGAGFLENEMIDLSISIDDPASGYHVSDYEWTQFATDANGSFVAQYVVPEEAADMFLTATAMGLASGRIAIATFTDHPPSNFTAASAAMTLSGSTVSLSVSVTQTGGSATVITGVKASGATANGVSLVLSGPGTANGNGTWSGSFAGECGRTYRWDKVEITQNHTTGSGAHPAERAVTVADLAMPACATDTVTTCPGTGGEGDTSVPVSADVTDTGAVNEGQALTGGHVVDAGSVTFDVVRESDGVVVGTGTFPVTAGTTGGQSVPVAPLLAGPHTVVASYSGVTSAPPGRIRCAPSSGWCGFNALSLCEPVTEVTIASPLEGALLTAANCADLEVTVSASADGTSPVLSYALDGGAPQTSSTLVLPLGAHTITVLAANDCTLAPVSASVTVIVKAETVLTLGTLPESFLTGACDRVVCATLEDSCGTALPGRTVDFEASTDGGASFFALGSGTTDAAGVSCLTFGLNLAPGEVSFRASFAEDDTHLASDSGVSDPVAVVYDFGGFGPPVARSATTGVKRGSTVPVKFRLFDCSGNEICGDLGLGPHEIGVYFQSGVAPSGDPAIDDAGSSNDDGTHFRYGGSCGIDGNWIFNLKTGSDYALGATYRIEAYLNDGTIHNVFVSAKR
jgi:hypothetical protein